MALITLFKFEKPFNQNRYNMDIENIKGLIKEVENGIIQLENDKHNNSKQDLESYLQNKYSIKSFLGYGKPEVYSPSWKDDEVCATVNELLNKDVVNRFELSEELNIYYFNVVVEIMRLRGDKELKLKAEQLKKYAKELKEGQEVLLVA